jgi:preprotein translocase SecF subunit
MKLKIIEKRNIFFAISGLIILIGLIVFFAKGFNKGIDFTGGTMIQIDMKDEVSVSEVREITDQLDKDAHIIHAGDLNHEIIIKSKMDLSNDERLEFFSKFKEKYNLEDKDLIQSTQFGAKIGSEIQRNAVLSIIFATILMLIYITFRFEFKFGVSAVIALVHDVLIALSIYLILQLSLDSSFIAAILTIVGYSINDTIVVFDRIRENKKTAKRKEYAELINHSISQTVVRSINTSVTTLVTIVCLYLFGVEAVKNFALPLIVGVIVGTYSSIFIASPVWYLMSNSKKLSHKRA